MTNSPPLLVSVQQADFDVAALQRQLLGDASREGAVATFTGYVRADNEQGALQAMELEHYPGMTEKSILEIMREATGRWPVLAASVVHRIGKLQPGEQIVWVGVASSHREAAFLACEFIMDYLKHRAPFWKKEIGAGGGRWVETRSHDETRARRWGGASSQE